MWRIQRKIIFPRWYATKQNNVVDNKDQNTIPKALVLCQVHGSKNYSNEKKQHADKRDKKCWDDPQFNFYFLRSSLFETAGLLGAVGALYLNVHLKHSTNIFEDDRPYSCLLSRNVLAMPRHSSSKENTYISLPPSSSLSPPPPPPLISPQVNNSGEDKISSNASILEGIRHIIEQHEAFVDNSVGIANLDKNNRKAFRHFQAAARLGSSQAFYNLGLCYQLGKGTRINLSRAAFCYRKAAVKGHGLAAFNLAVFFMKGIGGLPVDAETAKLLLAEAAKKGVPEALLYLGIEHLENERWLDAFAIFNSLAKENIPEGQYYLGMCYENGWGIEKNDRVALELFKKSADQGNEKAAVRVKKLAENNKKKLYHMLKNRSNRNSQKYLAVWQVNQGNLTLKETALKSSAIPNKSLRDNHLHESTSAPELTSGVKISAGLFTKISTPLYLDLTIPFIARKNSYEQKPSFFIGDNTMKEDCSSHLLCCSVNIAPKMMEVKT